MWHSLPMQPPVPNYTPPDTATMAVRQNTRSALRFLLAQRRLYTKAKSCLSLRWFGMVVIGLAAPVVSVTEPHLAVVVGAVAGLWLFAGRTLIIYIQTGITAAAAAVQEEFDFLVFGMPTVVPRSVLPSPEAIAKLVGPDSGIDAAVAKEKLIDWYPFNVADPGVIAVAIAQRTNAAYSGSLLRTTARIWASAIAVWIIGLVAFSVALHVPLSSFLVGVIFPVLPGALDVAEYIGQIRSASRERDDLASAIEAKIRNDAGGLTPTELLVWQEQLFYLRKATPDVPNWIYEMRRKTNERAMTTAAQHLGTTPPSL